MTRNDFLQFEEALYQIHTSENWMQALHNLIPCFYLGLFPVKGTPKVFPESALWQDWMSYWRRRGGIPFSNRMEVQWDIELWEQAERRRKTSLYQKAYGSYDIFDGLTLSLVREDHPLGLLLLLRTRAEGGFSAKEVFYLQRISRHLLANQKFIEELTETVDTSPCLSAWGYKAVPFLPK